MNHHDPDVCCCSMCIRIRGPILTKLPEGHEMPEQSTVAAEAHAAVYGERGKDYGHPSQNFADTARIWNALLHDKLSDEITAEDVARCMIGLKLARDLHSPKRDNRVDICGYAITLDRLETGH